MADGHLGWAQMADAVSVGHLGLSSNFQPSLKWLTAYLKVANFMVVHLWHVSCSYTVCMYSQFLHHALITCTLRAVLTSFLHMLTYFQAYCIVAKMASQGEAESQVPFQNHVLKIPEREALTVCQCSERLKFYGRQLHVVSI